MFFLQPARWRRVFALCALAAALPVAAQEASQAPAAEPSGKAVEAPASVGETAKTEAETIVERADKADDLELAFPRKLSFDLTDEQKERFRKHLPNSYRKLSGRRPFHIVALGDSIVDMFSYDEDAQHYGKSYPARFAELLARQFFYTGGVRVIRPAKGKPEKLQPHLGTEITFRSVGRGGKLAYHASQGFSTFGLENKPDLVLASFGINDATVVIDTGLYAKALRDLVEQVREAGAEIMLLGPTLTIADPPEQSLALTRPYADIMRQVAEETGVFYADLGELGAYVQIDERHVDPARFFSDVVEQYRRFFDHEGAEDFIHPRAHFHKVAGQLVFDRLINGEPVMPWGTPTGTARLRSNGELEVSFTWKNSRAEDLRLTTLPLVGRAWVPKEGSPAIEIPAGGETAQRLVYTKRFGGGTEVNPLPSNEPILRLPVLARAGASTGIVTIRTEVEPVVLLWQVAAQTNLEEEFSTTNQMINTSSEKAAVEWRAEWLGQAHTGRLEIDPGQSTTLPLLWKLPDWDAAPFWRRSTVKAIVGVAGEQLEFERKIDIAKNFGLKQVIPLCTVQDEQSPPVPELGSTDRAVTLRMDADNNNLFFTFDIRGIELRDGPDGNAWLANLSIDARSYGKRLLPGATDIIRLNGAAADGPATVAPIPPWAFGDGYAARFDEKQVRAVVSSGAEGSRRVTVTIPRAYFYLHEWALGNGNSQLGINVAISLWRPDEKGGGGYPLDHQFVLLRGQHRDKAQGLAVLELTDNPTRRWMISLQ
jgi:lysophospholipase L1-like esterase